MRRISWVAVAALVLGLNTLAWVIFVHSGPSSVSSKQRRPVFAKATTKPADPLKLTSAAQCGYDADAKTVELNLTFDHAADPAAILPRLQVLRNENHRVTIHLKSGSSAGSATPGTMHVVTDPMPAIETEGDWTLQLALLDQPVPGDQVVVTKEHTEVSIATDQRVVDVKPIQTNGTQPRISVTFSSPIGTTDARDCLHIEPSMPVQVEQYGPNNVQLIGDFKPATRYAVRIDARKPGQDANEFPRGGLCSVFMPDQPAGIWFDHADGYLGADGTRRIPLHANNVASAKITIWKSYDSNLVVWRNSYNTVGRRRNYWGESYPDDPDSRIIATSTLTFPLEKNHQQDRVLSLDELLPPEHRGDGVFRIEVQGKPLIHEETDDEDAPREVTARCMVTLSDIALTAKYSDDQLVVWATSLHDAKPLPGVRVRGYTPENQLAGEALTDESGLCTMRRQSDDGHPIEVVLGDHAGSSADTSPASGSQLTWLDLRQTPLSTGEAQVHGAPRTTDYDAFVYSDRGVYRPGEAIHLRTVVRDASLHTPTELPIELAVMGPDHRSRTAERAVLDRDGSAAWTIALPPESPTGHWTASVRVPGDVDHSMGTVSFGVEEFVPERLRTSVSLNGVKDFTPIDHPLEAAVRCAYLFGQPAANLSADLKARIDPEQLSFPQWSGWTFNDDGETAVDSAAVHARAVEQEFEDLTLDDAGQIKQAIDCTDLMTHSKEPQVDGDEGPWRLSLNVEVSEASGRAVADRTSIRLDRASRYVGIRQAGEAALPGQLCYFDVKTFRPDGAVDTKAADLSIQVSREAWNTSWSLVKGRYTPQSTRTLEKLGEPTTVHIDAGSGQFSITPPTPGKFAVAVLDPQTHRTVSTLMTVAGDTWADSVSQEHPESLEVTILPRHKFSDEEVDSLLPPMHLSSPLTNVLAALRSDPPKSADGFAGGDTALVMVRSPFAGTLLLSEETDQVTHTQVVQMTGSTITLPMQLDRDAGPNVFVTASVVRPIDPKVAWRVHRASGVAAAKIDQRDHHLLLAIAAPPTMKPEQSLPLQVRCTDSTGHAIANAAVTFAVVDQGICQLTRFITPDPFAYFTRWRQLGVSMNDTYAALMPDVAADGNIGGDGAPTMASAGRHTNPVSAKRIHSLAMVSGLLHTDGNGVATTSFPMPPFVGAVRVMAAGFADDRFGATDQEVTVKSDLVVQSSWPRFAAPGDRFRVPLVIFNNTKSDGDATVLFETDIQSPLLFENHQPTLKKTVHVPAGQSSELDVDAIASGAAGAADVLTNVTLNGQTFHETVSLPIRPAAGPMTVSDTKTLSPGAPLAFVPPSGMMDGVGGTTITVSPRPSLNLQRGLQYLNHYPYGCSEQTTSTLFPLVYLSNLKEQIPGLPDKKEIDDKVEAGIDRLAIMQNNDGALPMWMGDHDWPWVSVYAAHFLAVAQQARYRVPTELHDHLLDYVRSRLAVSGDDPQLVELQAYACYVLALSRQPDISSMSRLTDLLARPVDGGPMQSAQTAFHLAAAWQLVGEHDRANRLLPRAVPMLRKDRLLDDNIDSPVREAAVMLSTLLTCQPDHPQIPALVKSLVESGRAGQWRCTQDTAFAVMALGQYAKATKDIKPFSHCELWAGDQKLAASDGGQVMTWQGKLNEMAGPFSVRVDGDPAARGYVDWVSDGVPLKPATQPVGEGMEISRRYIDEDGKPLDISKLRSGQLVRAELTLICPQAIRSVVIDDLLPAGLEGEGAQLFVSAATDPDHEKYSSFQTSHVDCRDDRVTVFCSIAAPGDYRGLYSARAVTCGTFVVPPTNAECMYDLSMHATSAGGQTMTIVPASHANANLAAARAE